MTVRPAQFPDVLPIADIIYRRSRGKSTEHLCRSRVDQCIKRSRGRAQGFRRALVAEDGGGIRGFLFAEERNMFDLCPNVRAVEVPFLVGSTGAAVPLMRELRGLTKLPILVISWGMLTRPLAVKRLLRPLRAQAVGVIYQL